MYRIQARRIGTRVLRSRTPLGGDGLLRRIRNVIALVVRRAAVTLENVQKTMPVPDLVHRRTSTAIMRNRAARHRRRQDIASVIDIVFYGTRRVDFGVWKRAES